MGRGRKGLHLLDEVLPPDAPQSREERSGRPRRSAYVCSSASQLRCPGRPQTHPRNLRRDASPHVDRRVEAALGFAGTPALHGPSPIVPRSRGLRLRAEGGQVGKWRLRCAAGVAGRSIPHIWKNAGRPACHRVRGMGILSSLNAPSSWSLQASGTKLGGEYGGTEKPASPRYL